MSYFLIILLILSFCSISKKQECKEMEIIPNSENVKFIGRFYIKDEAIWLVLSGSVKNFI